MKRQQSLVLITGATRGLGNRIAHLFFESGSDLILIARNYSELQKMKDTFLSSTKSEQKISIFSFDLAETELLSGFIKEIIETCGNPDILVNNAASQGPVGPIYENDWEEWERCMKICLIAPVQICKGFIPGMMENHYGRIINISGGGATSPRSNFSSYATAKAGLVRFSEIIACELLPYGITVNCVAPGIMYSDLTRSIIKAGKRSAGDSEYDNAINLQLHNTHNEEIAAELVYFLTSMECNTITGKLISAVWDPWKELPKYLDILSQTDIYTLRRIIPADRNLTIE